ncbi:lecithin retinol acyltransferase family protein [Cyanobium sp. WKJ7-Wakatipu]|uniref:lecithin retinol acyltransferase family protein n=1 Tax=Cyanobium sp. WKJ7-Wakatipu TaxID=2823726 RepID=UPI0020CCFB9C|nr:lecithin retinol acyltransferase family protein [Cyanobium sp. WKJ7-Wakatipu]MCP9783657.1 lecithin retinol acyltransferase family protein [Cyanobium sp. WKJ7-Wakatipu]
MSAADHLQVPRQHGLFLHHGIDLGDGSVAHYLEGREILRSPLADFSRGEPVAVVPYAAGDCSPAGVTLRRAMGRLGEQNYNLLFNNCEHFAHWCKTGRHSSAQVEDLLHTGSLGALAIGQWVPAAMLSAARMLLRQGNLAELDKLRQGLQQKLEQELGRAEARWGQDHFENLRLAAQKLADQLTAVEELEERLRRQLEPDQGH